LAPQSRANAPVVPDVNVSPLIALVCAKTSEAEKLTEAKISAERL
jgi:hypothetical protein